MLGLISVIHFLASIPTGCLLFRIVQERQQLVSNAAEGCSKDPFNHMMTQYENASAFNAESTLAANLRLIDTCICLRKIALHSYNARARDIDTRGYKVKGILAIQF